MSANENNDVCMMLDLGEPPEYVKEYALNTLGETEERRACALQELKDMIYETGEVVPHRVDDAYLLRFLRARYFNVTNAHKLMVNYYKFKAETPDIQEGVSYLCDSMQYIADEDIISVLPYRDQHGRRIMIYRIGPWDPSVCDVEELFKASLILLELAILEQRAQILGGICFFDLENLSLAQAWQMTPSVASRVLQLMGKSFPIRLKEVHILNQPWLFDMIYAIFKPLLDERQLATIHFHGSNFETLHNCIDPKNLPKRYGGARDEFKNSDWIESLDRNPKIVGELVSLGYKCELRVTETSNGEKTENPDLQETSESQAVCQN